MQTLEANQLVETETGNMILSDAEATGSGKIQICNQTGKW